MNHSTSHAASSSSSSSSSNEKKKKEAEEKIRALVLEEAETYRVKYRQEILAEFPKAHSYFPKAHSYIDTNDFLIELTGEILGHAGVPNPDGDLRFYREMHQI